MDATGYQPAWPDDIWPWIRRPTITTQQSGALVDYSWGATVPGTPWRVFGQRPWHSDTLLAEIAADPEVRRALEALEAAHRRLAADAEVRGLVAKPTRLGGLVNGVRFSGANHSFEVGIDDILVNLHEIVDGFVHRAVRARIPVGGPEFVKRIVAELTATLAEELAHTTGAHRVEIDTATGRAFEPIHRLADQMLDSTAAPEVRTELARDFRAILRLETLRKWGQQYARLRAEADDDQPGRGGDPGDPDSFPTVKGT